MESLSGPIKVFYRQNRISKPTKSTHFWTNFNILFQKKRVEDPNRVLLYIREADTEVYDALMLESPDLNGLTKAVSDFLLKMTILEIENWIFDLKNYLFSPKTTFVEVKKWFSFSKPRMPRFTSKSDHFRGQKIYFRLKIRFFWYFSSKRPNSEYFFNVPRYFFSKITLNLTLFSSDLHKIWTQACWYWPNLQKIEKRNCSKYGWYCHQALCQRRHFYHPKN